jgi:hypothetical protein
VPQQSYRDAKDSDKSHYQANIVAGRGVDGHNKVHTCSLRGFLVAFAVAGAFRFFAPVTVPYEIKTHRFSRKAVAPNPSVWCPENGEGN